MHDGFDAKEKLRKAERKYPRDEVTASNTKLRHRTKHVKHVAVFFHAIILLRGGSPNLPYSCESCECKSKEDHARFLHRKHKRHVTVHSVLRRLSTKFTRSF